MSSRLPSRSLLLLLAATACGSPGTADDDPTVDARAGADASTDAAPQPPRTFSLTIPATGETMDLAMEGSFGVKVTRPPARLRLVRTSLLQSTNAGFLTGTTLAAKCADFDSTPFVHGTIAPWEYGTFGFTVEYGPRSADLRAAIRAELDRRGWLAPGGFFEIGYPWGAIEASYTYAAGARSPTIPANSTPTPPSVAAVGETTFNTMFDWLESSQSNGVAPLSIGYVCDLANGKAMIRATAASSAPIALELVLTP